MKALPPERPFHTVLYDELISHAHIRLLMWPQEKKGKRKHGALTASAAPLEQFSDAEKQAANLMLEEEALHVQKSIGHAIADSAEMDLVRINSSIPDFPSSILCILSKFSNLYVDKYVNICFPFSARCR